MEDGSRSYMPLGGTYGLSTWFVTRHPGKDPAKSLNMFGHARGVVYCTTVSYGINSTTCRIIYRDGYVELIAQGQEATTPNGLELGERLDANM